MQAVRDLPAAEPILAKSYDALSKAYGLSDPRTRTASPWLAALYRRTNRAEQGDKLIASSTQN